MSNLSTQEQHIAWLRGELEGVRTAHQSAVRAWTFAAAERDRARAEVERLADGIRERHQPITVEVEKYHDDDHFPGELEGDCPDGDGCPGHLMEEQTCGECGYLADLDFEVAYRPWPCPTAALLDVAADDREDG